MIALGKTAQLSNKSPAELMGLDDPLINLAFDLEVMATLEVERLRELTERDKQLAEILAAATGISLTNQALPAAGEY